MAGEIKHEWLGTTLVITSDSGTSGCDLKGDRGDIGIRGPQGPQGEKPEVFFTVGVEDKNLLETEYDEISVSGVKLIHEITRHYNDFNNPHNITCEQIGADVVGSAAAVQGQLLTHIDDADNPHHVSAEQVGLGNVDNTADMDKPVSTAQQAAINEVRELVNGNTESINSINDTTTGLLAQAKAYTDLAVGNAEAGVVSSVNGKTGAVVIASEDIYGLDEAIDAKMPKTGGVFTGAVKLGTGSSTTAGYAANYLAIRNIAFSSTGQAPSNNCDIALHYG